MSKITLSAEAASALEAVTSKSELCGPDGRRLGFFIPPGLAVELEAIIEARRRLYEDDDDVTLEELKAIDAAGGAIPHDEAMKRLGLE